VDVGLYIDAHLGIGEQARMIEEAGFTYLWAYDSPLVYAEPYMALLEAARATSTLKVGPGVTHPRSRSVVATAQALGTLAVAAPGRVTFGIGVGNSARFSLGQGAAGLREMRDYALDARRLLRGEAIDYDEGDGASPVRLIHPEGRWLDLSHPFELWVSSFGPRGQRLAGGYADGVYMRWEGAEKLAAARRILDAGAVEAGREPGSVKIGLLTALYPIEDERELGEAEAVGALGPLAVSRLRFLSTQTDDPAEVPGPFRDAFASYLRDRAGRDPVADRLDGYEGYLVVVEERLAGYLTPELMRAVALVGRPERIVAELRAMETAGADQVGLQIAGPPRRWCERMAAIVDATAPRPRTG
jgi:5,10-methylenetetrahydromethanopterin reductase